MKITAIKEQVKNLNRVSIFVEGKYSFSLTLDQLLEQKLKKDEEVDAPTLIALKKLSDEGKLKAKALDWLMMRPHSTREFSEYAYRKKIDKDLVSLWIGEFTDKKYLDDESFARWFAENRIRKSKSKRAIVAELSSKGISSNIARVIVDELVGDDDVALIALILKLRTRTRYKDEQKLISHLVGKGFGYSDIKKCLENLEQ